MRRTLAVALRLAGLPVEWTSRELRHSSVSLMSANGASIELIARLVGHTTTATTEAVYRHELRPVITEGAEIIGKAFGPDRPRPRPIGGLLGSPAYKEAQHIKRPYTCPV